MKQPYLGKSPVAAPSARAHETAVLIGEVRLSDEANIWPGAVLRADIAPVVVGRRTNIQDLCVLHVDHDKPAVVGDDCVVGHSACIHACTVGNRCLVGIHSTILTGAVIGDECVIGAGALVGEDKVIPPRSLVLGVPGRVVRRVTDEEVEQILRGVSEYLQLAGNLLPPPR